MDEKQNLTYEALLTEAAAARNNVRYVLRLFIISTTPKSMRAVANVRRICDEHLAGRYDLEVIDLTDDPARAESEQIIAAPTLIKMLPLPLRRFIGDLSATEHVMLGLDLHSAKGSDDVPHGQH